MNLQGGEILISRRTEEKTYEVLSPMLDPEDNDEWILRDGRAEVKAHIHDLNFLEAVLEGMVTFTHGCRIQCRMQESRWMVPEGIRTEYRIKEVLGVRNPGDEKPGDKDWDEDWEEGIEP